MTANRSDLPLRMRPLGFAFQHLRYAVAAADHGSFRRAADALMVRQSTLSRCIRQLEESIGMIVFERSSGGVRATQAGQKFPARGQIDSGANGCARGDRAQRRLRRVRTADDRLLYVAVCRKPARDIAGLCAAVPADRHRHDGELADASRHRAAERRPGHRDCRRRRLAARQRRHAALERADRRGVAGMPSIGGAGDHHIGPI